MANNWANYANYLDALAKQKNPSYSPLVPQPPQGDVTQADMGNVSNGQPTGQPPVGESVMSFAPPPRQPAAANPFARPSKFEDRVSAEDLGALKNLLSRQEGDAAQIRGQADTIANAPEKTDLTPLLAAADAWGSGKTSLAKSYDKPLKPEERAKLVAQLRNIADDNESGVTKTRLQLLQGGDKNDIAALKSLMTEQGRGLASKSKEEKKVQKDLSDLGKSLDENQGRSGEFGRQAQFVNNADRVLALAKQFPDYKLPRSQFAELAGASAALVTGGSHPAESVIQQYIPHTLANNKAGILEWLTSKATPAETQSFAKLMVETAERERALAASKVKAIKFSRVAEKSHLKGAEGWDAVLRSKQINPEEYDDYVRNGYKLPEAAAAPAAGHGGGGMSTKDAEAVEWAKANSKDPRAAKILQLHGM